MKKFLKVILVFSVLALAGGSFAIYRYFKKTEAPILQGELEYNIEYKQDLKLDVYEPTQKVYERNPVVVYIHGGAWITGSKISVNNDRFNGAFNTLREKGYAVVSPDYTLAELGKSPFPACLSDAFDAIHWIETHADAYNFDLENVGLLGESAGGHIALMLAYDQVPEFSQPISIPFRYMVGVYPPTSLFKLYQDQIPLMDSVAQMTENWPESVQQYFNISQYLFGFDPAEDTTKTKAFTEQYSPIHFVSQSIPNTLLIHGNADRVVPVSQSHVLKERLDAKGIRNEMHILDGVDHAFGGATEEQKAQVQNWISQFVLDHYVHRK